MLVKVHFLNWDNQLQTERVLSDDVLEKSLKIYMNSMLSRQETFEKECYRTSQVELNITADEIQDPESFLELVFCELNSDTRSNGSYERSMCAGDVIEFEGKGFIVLGVGFNEIAV